MAGFRPLLPPTHGDAEGFVPLHGRAPGPVGAPDSTGFVTGFRPLVPGRLGAEHVHGSDRDQDAVQVPAIDAAPEVPDDVTDAAPEVEVAAAPEPELPASRPEDISLVRAREEGFALGRAEGIEKGEAEVRVRLERLETLLETLESLRRDLFERSVTDVAAAVTQIAAAVVHRELRIDSTGVEALVIDVLDHVRAEDDVLIRVAPEDLRHMQGVAPHLLEHLGRDATFRIDSDPGLSPGGATIETQLGAIDASVETRFAAFADAVQEWAGEEANADVLPR
jgi:flagellar assembly protein FliH